MTNRVETEPTGVVTLTAAKLIGGLIFLITTVLAIQTFIFTNIVEAKIERLGLVYATRQEIVPRTEFEIRRAELQDEHRRANERISATERDIADIRRDIASAGRPRGSGSPSR